MFKRLCLCAVNISLLFFSLAGTCFAAANANSSGLSVSPAITQASLLPNQKVAVFSETVTNVSNIPLTINVYPQDFGSIGGAGTINFFSSANYNPANNPHGLQNSVQLSANQFVLPVGVSKTVLVNIVNAENLAAGGHYGAIIYKPSAISSLLNNVKVNFIPSVASLIFLVTAGGGTQNLHLSNILQSRISFSLPKTTSFIMANSGNTQTDPIGYIKLSGPGHNLIAQAIINHTSALILPSSSVLMSVNLPTHSSFFTLPGIYSLKLVYGHSGSNNLTSISKSFLYINLSFIVLLIIVLIVLVLIIRFIIRKYRRKKNNKKS
jgi:hypothetical protein